MKSSTQHIDTRNVSADNLLATQMRREKEALVSMFLSNASITELAAQYKVIDELNSRIGLTAQKPR